MWSSLNSSNEQTNEQRIVRPLWPIEEWPLQAEVVRGLYRQIEDGRVPHAMLFVGTASVTKPFAVFLAKVLLCTGVVAPCGECPSCKQMQADNHADYVRVAPEDKTSVKAGQIEQLQSRITRRSHGGRMVYAIEGLDELSPVAANRLLKTLEEPIPSTFAILTAENDNRVLSTIKSRCFLYRLGAGEASWSDVLPDTLINPEDEENLSFAALLNPMIQWTEALLTDSSPPILLAAKFMKETSAADVSDALFVLSVWVRDLVHFQLSETEFIVCLDKTAELGSQSVKVPTERLIRALNIIVDTRRRLSSHVGAQLNVEQMCIRIREVFRSV